MCNFPSDLTGFICWEGSFAIQCNVFFRLQHFGLPPRDFVSGFFPLKAGWASPAEGWAIPCRIPSAFLKYLFGWIKLMLGSVLLEYVKDSVVIWYGICRLLAYGLLSYLIWDFLLFESSQEDAVGAILLRVMPPSSDCSPWIPLGWAVSIAYTPNPAYHKQSTKDAALNINYCELIVK